MDAFVKAAQEHFKDDKIGTKELFKLMEGGKLLSKDILPLVGKHLSQAARKGGALEKMLEGNMVAMNRLKQTWQSFQNAIFMGGFGSALTKWFNMLAAMLKQNEGAAKTFGAALGAVMDQLLDKITKLYDYILFLWLDFKYYILDNIPDGVKGIIADIAAWTAAMGILYKAFSGIFKILGMIMGLGGMSKILGGAASFHPIIRALMIAAALAKLIWELKQKSDASPKGVTSVGGAGIAPAETSNWLNSGGYGAMRPVPTTIAPPQASKVVPNTIAAPSQNPEPAKVSIKVDEGMLKDLIKVEIDDNNTNMINMIAGG